MFQQVFVPEHPEPRRRIGTLLSLSMQAGIVGAICLLRLIYTEPLPEAQLHSLLVGPPPPTTSQPRPLQERPDVSQRTATHASQFHLNAPVRIPQQIVRTENLDEISQAPSIEGAAPGADSGNNSILLGSVGGPSQVAPPKPVEPKAVPGPVRIGGMVAAANLIEQKQPVYPPLARSARVEGTVEFSAIIDKTGRVANLQLLHGHPLLVPAAREAILQWRYRPTLLNHEPVEVATTITVNFKLSN